LIVAPRFCAIAKELYIRAAFGPSFGQRPMTARTQGQHLTAPWRGVVGVAVTGGQGPL
jgi:hypothetical protein